MLPVRKPFLLIVDDDVSILNAFLRIFQRKGYNVTVANSGREAMEKLATGTFDVALIDFGLPDMEGAELFPVIQKVNPKTIKIMLTGQTHLEGTVTGADVFVGKPVNPEKLFSIIDSKLKEKNLESF